MASASFSATATTVQWMLARGMVGKDRGVGDAQPGDAVDLARVVDHRLRVAGRPHPAGARRMEGGLDLVADPRAEFVAVAPGGDLAGDRLDARPQAAGSRPAAGSARRRRRAPRDRPGRTK